MGLLLTLYHSAPIKTLAAVGSIVASGSSDDSIKIYDLSSLSEVGSLLDHSGPVTALSFYSSPSSPNLPLNLLSAGGDGTLNIYGASDDGFKRPRTVVKKVLARAQREGDGAIVRRSIGRPELKNLDPFLMLDEFSVSAPAGFPDHPHRGFETVTFMLEGAFTHQDFSGHKGTIRAGGLQWMTAGRGIIHSEMPAGDGVQKGLQLWINLSSKNKILKGYLDDDGSS